MMVPSNGSEVTLKTGAEEKPEIIAQELECAKPEDEIAVQPVVSWSEDLFPSCESSWVSY
jgi:hypothetical protein